ncbi:Transcriptional regulator, TetR family protein [Minicystis rosea]|nr:Transcriptional regulator, TetR family protein [Minicystis rosea]
MGRPTGSRNPDFEATRARLAGAALDRLGAPDGTRASFRELAAAAGVSVATMRHYFGSREGLVTALMEMSNAAGQRYLLEVAAGPIGPVAASLAEVLRRIGEGFRQGALARIHAIGLSAGLREPTLGPAYLSHVLDPTIEALEARLSRHIARGELRPGDVRYMALSLLTPPFMALLHQHALGGACTRPLSYEAFCADHLAGFLRAYGAAPHVDDEGRDRPAPARPRRR